MLKQAFLDKSLSFLSSEEKVAFTQKIEGPSVISIRYNTRKYTISEAEKIKVKWCNSGQYINNKPVFTLDPLFHAGAYYVQEASSMFLEQFVLHLDLPDDAFVLDLCASPGGKSTHLLNLMKPSQLLVSNEVIKTRVSTLKENLIKWGHENIVVTQNDSEDFKGLESFFDMIVVDAPCSGEGMFRKDKNAIEEWSPENVEICYKRQRRILSDIADTVKDGGYLIYATCTYNQKEDEGNMQWFLDTYNYEEVRCPQSFAGVIACDHGYKLMPHRVEGEGFYICCLRKKGTLGSYEFFKSKHTRLDLIKADQELRTYLKPTEALSFYTFQETVKALNPYHKTAVDFLTKHLNIVTAGLDMADLLKNKQLIPTHSLAMSIHVNQETFDTIDLDKEMALKFLKKELNDIDCVNGLHLASYMGVPIGFFKKINNRINNNYPQEWRIRMNL